MLRALAQPADVAIASSCGPRAITRGTRRARYREHDSRADERDERDERGEARWNEVRQDEASLRDERAHRMRTERRRVKAGMRRAPWIADSRHFGTYVFRSIRTSADADVGIAIRDTYARARGRGDPDRKPGRSPSNIHVWEENTISSRQTWPCSDGIFSVGEGADSRGDTRRGHKIGVNRKRERATMPRIGLMFDNLWTYIGYFRGHFPNWSVNWGPMVGERPSPTLVYWWHWTTWTASPMAVRSKTGRCLSAPLRGRPIELCVSSLSFEARSSKFEFYASSYRFLQ